MKLYFPHRIKVPTQNEFYRKLQSIYHCSILYNPVCGLFKLLLWQGEAVVCDLNKCKLITQEIQYCSGWCLEWRTYSKIFVFYTLIAFLGQEVWKRKLVSEMVKGGVFFSSIHWVCDLICLGWYLASIFFQAPQIMKSKTWKQNNFAGLHFRTAKHEEA